MTSLPEPATSPRRLEDMLDTAAAGASLLCIVHCLVLPLALAALPTLARAVPIPESFHIAMVILAFPTSLWALLAGRSLHLGRWPLVAGVAGLGLMCAGLLLEPAHLEVQATVAGSLLLCVAHLWNWRMRHAVQKPVARARLLH